MRRHFPERASTKNGKQKSRIGSWFAALAVSGAFVSSPALGQSEPKNDGDFFACIAQPANPPGPTRDYMDISMEGDTFTYNIPSSYFPQRGARMSTESIGENLTEVRMYTIEGTTAHMVELGWTDQYSQGIRIYRGTISKFRVEPGTTDLMIDETKFNFDGDSSVEQRMMTAGEISDEALITLWGLNCGYTRNLEAFRLMQTQFSAAAGR